jgi:hypothetical protein
MINQVTVNNIEFDVYYSIYEHIDPYGTGDSPTRYEVDIISIEVGTDTQNVMDILPDSILLKIDKELLKLYL